MMHTARVKSFFPSLKSIATVLTASVLVSCNIQLKDSFEQSSTGLKTIDFQTWCKGFELQNCNLQINNSIPADQWRVGVDVFSEVMNSNTVISLSRSDFDRRTVQDLFSTFGATAVLSFVSKIPWNSVEKDDTTLVLRNSGNNSVATFNGLRLIGNQTVVTQFASRQQVSITGLTMTDAAGGQAQTIKIVDLSQPSRLAILTDKMRIENIPIQFFQLPGIKHPPTLTPSLAFTAIANVVLEPNFNWRKNLSVFLNGKNLNTIFSRIQPYIPKGPADTLTSHVFNNTDTLMVGGATSNILLSMQMKTPLKCKFTVRNIPILGSLNFDLDLLRGFGLTNILRTKADTVKTDVYGLKTSIGTIQSVEVDSAQARIRVGTFTVPVDFKPANTGRGGPAIDKVQCQKM